MRLESTGIETLVFSQATGAVVEEWEIETPSPRDVTEQRPQGDGIQDDTAYHDEGTAKLVVRIQPTASMTRQQIADKLGAFLRPDVRSYLYWQDSPDDDERRILLRGSRGRMPRFIPSYGRSLCQWVTPDGVSEAAVESQVTLTVGGGTEQGRTYDQTYDKTYPASNPLGSREIVNEGTSPVYPTITVVGPIEDPVIDILSPVAKSITFDGLTLQASEQVVIDCREASVLFNNDPTDSRYDDIDTSASDPLTTVRLEPGTNVVRLSATSSSGAAAAIVAWRHAWYPL